MTETIRPATVVLVGVAHRHANAAARQFSAEFNRAPPTGPDLGPRSAARLGE